MFITKSSLSRRTVLRGLGATLSLPLLDAMVPALTPTVRTAGAPTKRGPAPYGWAPRDTRIAELDRETTRGSRERRAALSRSGGAGRLWA